MTLKGALNQLQELKDAEDMPMYFKPCLKEIIHTIQTDAQERKEGEWIDDDETNEKLDTYLANCSKCGYQMDVHNNRGYFNFCPNCGARMF